MKRLSNILQSPLFFALFITLLVILFLPDFFNKYKVEIIDNDSPYINNNQGSFNLIYFNDLNNDGKSEKIRFTRNGVHTIQFIIFDNNDGVINQINFFSSRLVRGSKLIFGDYDNNGFNEIYFFTQKEDSLFIQGFEPFNKTNGSCKYIKPKFIDIVLKKGKENQYRAHINCGKVINFDNDTNFKELVFSISTGFSLQPRNFYIFDIVNDTILKSPKSGAFIEKACCCDLNKDAKPEIIPYQIIAQGNIENFPYSDQSAWLMIFNNQLKFLFNPIEFPLFCSKVTTVPYKIHNQFFLAVLYQYKGTKDKKSGLYLYNINGKKIKEKIFLKENKTANIQMISLDTKRYDRLYLYNLKGDIVQLDENLDTIQEYRYNKEIHKYPDIMDIDGDSEKEIIFLSKDNKNLIIARNDFSHPVTIHIPNSNSNGYNYKVITLKLNGNKQPYLSVQLGNKWYLLKYSKNLLYYIKYLIYIGIFTCLFLFLFIIKKIWIKKLEQDKQKLENLVKERTLEIQEKNEILQQQNEEIHAQKDEIVAQRDRYLDQKKELEFLFDIAIERKDLMQKQNNEILSHKENLSKKNEQLNILNKELEKLSIVAKETDNSIIIMDNKGNIEWANAGFERLYDIDLRSYLKKHDRNILKNSSNKNIETIFNRCIITKKSIVYESPIKRLNGNILYIQTTLTPILNKNLSPDNPDYISKLIAIDTDITKLKKMQQQLLEAEKMASLGSLVAGVAHELNTPIGIGITASSVNIDKIKHLIGLFKEQKMKRSDFKTFLETIYESNNIILNNLNRAADLIQSFKQVSVDQTTEQMREFNLRAYVEDIVKSLNPKLKHTQIELKIDIPDNVTIFSYPGLIAQIFTNFVINSLIHGFDKDNKGKINIKAQQEDELVIIEYMDNGKGMTEEVRQKVFDPFFTTDMTHGTGLGMSIVYNIVTQKLKGSITCQSKINKGVLFRFVIPKHIN